MKIFKWTQSWVRTLRIVCRRRRRRVNLSILTWTLDIACGKLKRTNYNNKQSSIFPNDSIGTIPLFGELFKWKFINSFDIKERIVRLKCKNNIRKHFFFFFLEFRWYLVDSLSVVHVLYTFLLIYYYTYININKKRNKVIMQRNN